MTWIFLGWMFSRLFVVGIDPVSPVPDGTVALDGTGAPLPQAMDGTGVGSRRRARWYGRAAPSRL
jgi:hypothetical protein